MVSATDLSDEDEEGALPDEIDEKGNKEDNGSVGNFSVSGSSSSASSSESSSNPTPTNLAAKRRSEQHRFDGRYEQRREQRREQQPQQQQQQTDAPSTAGLFCSPHSQGGSDGEDERENWQASGRGGQSKLGGRTSSGRSSGPGHKQNKNRIGHSRIPSEENSTFSRHKLSRITAATTAGVVPDTSFITGDFEDSTTTTTAGGGGGGGAHTQNNAAVYGSNNIQRHWNIINGQQNHYGATAEIREGPSMTMMPSTDFSLTASASSVTQLSTEGSVALTDDLIDSYNLFMSTLLSFPNQADNYYRMAMKNAYDTLTDYAKNLGVEGSEFLKHLYAYFILGMKVYTDLRGLQSVLTSTVTPIVPTATTAGPPVVVVAAPGQRSSPSFSPFANTAIVSPSTVQRSIVDHPLPNAQVLASNASPIGPFSQQPRQNHITYGQIDQSPYAQAASRTGLHYPPPPTQPPPESMIGFDRGGSLPGSVNMDSFHQYQQSQQQLQFESPHCSFATNQQQQQQRGLHSGSVGQRGSSVTRWNRQSNYTADSGNTADATAMSNFSRRSSQPKKRRINHVTAISSQGSQPMSSSSSSMEVSFNDAPWDEQQVLTIGTLSDENRVNNPEINLEYSFKNSRIAENSVQKNSSQPVKLETRECLSDITLDSDGDDDNLERSSASPVIRHGLTQRGCPPPPPPPPPGTFEDGSSVVGNNVLKKSFEANHSTKSGQSQLTRSKNSAQSNNAQVLPTLESCDELENTCGGGGGGGGTPRAPYDYSNNSTSCGGKTSAGITPPPLVNSNRTHYGGLKYTGTAKLAHLDNSNEEELQIDVYPPSAGGDGTPARIEPSGCSSAPPPPPPPPPPFLTPPQSHSEEFLKLPRSQHLHEDGDDEYYLRHQTAAGRYRTYHNRTAPIVRTAGLSTAAAASTPTNNLL